MTEQQTPYVTDQEKTLAEIRETLKYRHTSSIYDAVFKDNAETWLRFLLSELERLEREYAEERATHNAHVAELCELEQERDKLIEALRWYADEENQKLDESTRYWENVYSPYEIDGGQRARDILREIGVTVE